MDAGHFLKIKMWFKKVIARAGNCEIYESNEVGWQLITEGTLLLEIDKGLDCFIYMFRILIKVSYAYKIYSN